MNAIALFFQKPIFKDKRFIALVWFGAALIAGLNHSFKCINNNYLIFKYTYYHLVDQVNLYIQYPEEYFDSNHYGPIFSIIIAPFALLPDQIGTILWELFMASTLFWAIYKLPVTNTAQAIVYWIMINLVYVNAANSQTNIMIAALIIGSFTCIRSGKDFWAACFIALGIFIKLYGVVGLAFFFFSKDKIRFISSFIFWCIVFFILPMLLSSPQFVVQSYYDWFSCLIDKNQENVLSVMQDISLMGMIRKITGDDSISNLIILIPALILFALQYLKIDQYNNSTYQFGLLASVLMFVVLFSTGSETCTYVIAMAGAAIWFLIQKKPYSRYVMILFVSVLLISMMATSDIFPSYLRKHIMRPYALIAFPYFIVWITLIFQMLTIGKRKSLSDWYITDKS